MQIKERRYLFYAALYSFILGLCTFIYILIREHGLFSLFADFNIQQIPFNILANQAIKSGEVFWNWNIDLGSNFIGAFSFYNLGSPFFWITLFFPAKLFPYLAGWIYILKYTVAGALSYQYMQLFVKDKKVAVLASALYSFSGFQSTNILFYHFHDVVAFFPLMLYGMEVLLREKKKGVFAFAVFLNALLNYFFFIGEVIFIMIYFFVRFFVKNKKRWTNCALCLGEGILGTGMSAILFFPSIAFVISNPRVGEKIWNLGSGMLCFDVTKYLQIFRAFFLPAENMSYCSCLYQGEWSSCAAYLPMIGMALVIAFILTRPGHWISVLLIVSAIMALIPVLGSVFYVFNATVYQRWYYMPILLMSLASALVLENRKQYKIKLGIGLSAVAVSGLTISIVFIQKYYGVSLIYRPVVFGGLFVVALAGIICSYFILVKIKDHLFFLKSLYIGAAFFCVGTTMLNCVLYRKAAGVSAEEIYNQIEKVSHLDQMDSQYRYDCDENLITMTVPLAGIGSWCSTVGRGIFEFYDSMGLERTIINLEGPEGTTELLAGKYFITSEKVENADLIQENVFEDSVLYVYANPDVLPIGYTYETYMPESEFNQLPFDLRALSMIKTLIVEDDREETVKKYLRKYDPTIDGKISAQNKEEDINNHLKETCEDFLKTKNGFDAKINLTDDKYVFFSIPYDDGWRAEVNNKEVEILNVNGLMAVPAKSGENEIKFNYSIPFLAEGIFVTGISFLIFLIYCIVMKRKG